MVIAQLAENMQRPVGHLLQRHVWVLFSCLLIYGFMAFPHHVLAQDKPSVAVADFEIKSGGAYQLGRGMSDMLVNALVETGQFTVVERSRVDQLMREQGMALQGFVDASTGAQVGKMLGAQYLVLGVITEFDERTGGGAVGGLLSRKLGGGATMYTAHMGFTIRVIDATTGVIHASKSIDKEKRTVGGIGGGSLFGMPLGGGGFKSKAMQDVLEDGIIEAVDLLREELRGLPSQSTGTSSAAGGIATPTPTECTNLTGASAPRIMVVVPEKSYHQSLTPEGETVILRTLLEAGLNLVDQQQVSAIRDQEKVIHAFEDPRLAAQLGAEFGADLILIGRGTSENSGRSGNMASSRAHIEGRIIETRTGRILAANGMDGSGADVSPQAAARKAISSAASPLATYFLSQLCGMDLKVGGGSMVQTIEVMFSGISFGDLQRASSALERMSSVQDINKSLTGNVGRLQVRYTGDAEALAVALSELQSPRLEIVGLADNKIEAKLAK